jgi:hypothetical protein
MTHLTPEDLDQLLTQPAASHPHLATCEPCRNELAALAGSLNGLRQSLTFVAETTPMRLPQARAPRARAWVLATACLALAVAAVPVFHHPHPAPPAEQQTNQEDEALLEGIHQDLATPIAPPLKPLSLEAQ